MAKSPVAHRNLVKRYAVLIMGVVFMGLIVFGAILLFAAKEYFDDESHRALQLRALEASKMTTENLINTNKKDEYMPLREEVIANYHLLSIPLRGNINSFILLTNGKGEILMTSGDDVYTGQRVSEEFYIAAAAGEYFGYNKLGGIFEENSYIEGVPVYSPNNNIIGYIFVSSMANDLDIFLSYVTKVFIIGMIAVLAFTLTAVSIATDKLLSPLGEMSNAVKSLAKGDFSKRVPVDGDGYDEMSQLSMAFNNMVASLAAHEEISRSFVTNVSHELKTPMTTIGGFIDGILDGTIPEDKHRLYLQTVSEEVRRLARLVGSMLNISRIEAGEQQLKPSEFDIAQLTMQAVFNFEKRIEEKNLDVIGLDAEKQMVYADIDMIHQVVYNLVDNAVKFVNPNGSLEFSYRSEAGIRYIGIKNTGDGISKAEIQQVFNRFYKSDKSRSLNKDGVGLGLNIVKSIMDMHGGDIIVNSVEREYCEFVFTLPIKGKLNVKQQASKP